MPPTRRSPNLGAPAAQSHARSAGRKLVNLWPITRIDELMPWRKAPLTEQGPIRAWIIDDTGILKKGKHSVGVARQYWGELGKQDNCQVAVTLSGANDQASLPIALRLYLPEVWANDKTRRKNASVPKEVKFETKPQIALNQIRQAIADGVPKSIALADAGYGNDTGFRDALTEMGLSCIVGEPHHCRPGHGVVAAGK